MTIENVNAFVGNSENGAIYQFFISSVFSILCIEIAFHSPLCRSNFHGIIFINLCQRGRSLRSVTFMILIGTGASTTVYSEIVWKIDGFRREMIIFTIATIFSWRIITVGSTQCTATRYNERITEDIYSGRHMERTVILAPRHAVTLLLLLFLPFCLWLLIRC